MLKSTGQITWFILSLNIRFRAYYPVGLFETKFKHIINLGPVDFGDDSPKVAEEIANKTAGINCLR